MSLPEVTRFRGCFSPICIASVRLTVSKFRAFHYRFSHYVPAGEKISFRLQKRSVKGEEGESIDPEGQNRQKEDRSEQTIERGDRIGAIRRTRGKPRTKLIVGTKGSRVL